jgi:hypothetical protein
MDQYMIRWANKVQGVTKEEYLRIQSEQALLDSAEPVDFDSSDLGNLYSGQVVRNVQPSALPTVLEMPSIPPYSNPFHYDQFNMGCDLCGPWMAMYSCHAGIKQEHNKTEEDKQSSFPVFYAEPEYIIFVNQKTGQRFRLEFPSVIAARQQELAALRICDEG